MLTTTVFVQRIVRFYQFDHLSPLFTELELTFSLIVPASELEWHASYFTRLSIYLTTSCKLLCLMVASMFGTAWANLFTLQSCYIQSKTTADIPDYPDIENPYQERPETQDPHEYVPHLDTLDNGNTIIIFENSESGSINDTLITARQEWESRWRRLPFYLAYGTHFRDPCCCFRVVCCALKQVSRVICSRDMSYCLAATREPKY